MENQMKKTSKDLKNKDLKENRKLVDTPLNLWVKSLSSAKKDLFYSNLYSNRLIWAPNKDLSAKISHFNNYRYDGKIKGDQSYPVLINIYITALTIEPTLKIQTLFPQIEQTYISFLLPTMIELSHELNKFRKHEENKTQ